MAESLLSWRGYSMPTRANEGFVVDPLRFQSKVNAVCYLFGSGVTTLHQIEPELIVQGVEL